MKGRHEVHIERRIWHVCGVGVAIVLFHNTERVVFLILIGLLFIGSALIDVLRFKNPSLNKRVLHGFGLFMRKSEIHNITGITYVALGFFIAAYIFPKNIVTLAFLFLMLGDPLASYFGVKHGHDKLLGSKSVQGSLAAFVCCTAVALAFFYFHNLMVERIVLVSILAGLIGAVSELVPFGKLDDNLTLPVLSASLLYSLFYIFGGFPN